MRKIFLLVLSLAVLAGALSTGPADAATRPCNIVNVIAYAVHDGSVPEGYSLSCLYRARAEAAKDADLATYSDVDQVLRAAIVRAGGTPRPPTAVPTAGETAPSKTTGTATTTTPNPTKNVTRSTAALERPSGDGGELPAVVIALGVVAAAALVAAGVVELRRRRA
jgi:hypothetical protein